MEANLRDKLPIGNACETANLYAINQLIRYVVERIL